MRCWIVEQWKKEVLHSPSCSHLILDFCFHIISSCLDLSSICEQRCCSCFLLSFVLPSMIICSCDSSISFSSRALQVKILPKVCMFQRLRWFFKSFCFVCILSIQEEPVTWVVDHQSLIIFEKSGWVSQKFSNRKGFRRAASTNCDFKHIGQWSEPVAERMEVVNSSFLSLRGSVMRKRSSLVAIYAVPPLRLFQVWMPLLVSISTRPLLSIKSLKRIPS